MRQFNEYLSTKVRVADKSSYKTSDEILLDIIKVVTAVLWKFGCVKRSKYYKNEYIIKFTELNKYKENIVDILNIYFGYNFSINDVKPSGIIGDTIRKYENTITELYSAFGFGKTHVFINDKEYVINNQEDISKNLDKWFTK